LLCFFCVLTPDWHLLYKWQEKSKQTIEKCKQISITISREYNLSDLDFDAFEVFVDDHVIQDDFDTNSDNAFAFYIIQIIMGCIVGRWDVRFATGENSAPELSDPFAPLPVCPPGMLQNAEGLPAAPSDVPADYPLEINWNGILVDDAGNPHDIEKHLRDALHVIWKDRAEAIEAEACDILGVRSLREYFRRPAGFFADHLKRYSKSRRQAPIYLPLSTRSGDYTVWLYYHRLTDQTLYALVNDYVEPKLKSIQGQVNALRVQQSRTNEEERDFEKLQNFAFEMEELQNELLHWAPIWKPNLNDGVQITVSPLWKLFRLPKWRKTLEDTWKKLEKGEFDWAHLAYSFFPERVREKCKKDKSLAIAHDLEDLYIAPPAKAKKQKGKKQILQNIIDYSETTEI
jgi:hypothetical protein